MIHLNYCNAKLNKLLINIYLISGCHSFMAIRILSKKIKKKN